MQNSQTDSTYGVTVILSTYNRAEDLRKTLDAFCEVDISGLDVEFVVVDNNSSDNTPAVIDSFLPRLPLRHLFEARPGKNCALNHALAVIELKEIVVFTDDDVTPDRNWLREIISACIRWPEYTVFGGKITVCWPEGDAPPVWCSERWVQNVAFVLHDLGDSDHPYPEGGFPCGPNLWVRSSVFLDNKYNEDLGPRPSNRLMGSETSFMIGLANRGMLRLYVPTAEVKHRVQARDLNRQGLMRRAFRYGRSQPHLDRLKSSYQPNKINIISQIFELVRSACSLGYSYFPGKPEKRFASRFGALLRMGRAKELLKFSFEELWHGSR